MSEPFIERLSRFTPDAGKLDRDALLFAAGRRSARPNRAWAATTAALACTQILSLGLLWSAMTPRGETMVADRGSPRPASSQRFVNPEPASSDSLDSRSLWVARNSLSDSEVEVQPAPASAGTLIENEPPLRAFGPPAASMLN